MRGLRQFQRLFGGRGRLGNSGFQVTECSVEFGRQIAACLQRIERGLGGFAKFVVGHQIGIGLQRLQVVFQLRLELLVLRRLLQRFEQRLGVALLLFQLGFDRLHRLGRDDDLLDGFFGLDRLFLAAQAADEAVVVGRAGLQRIDEETQGRQFRRHRFEIRGVGLVALLAETLDLDRRLLQRDQRGIVTQNGERPGNLFDRRIEGGGIETAGRVAEEGIERLLDLAQIALDLARHLGNQQFFLRPAGHFVEQRHAFVGRDRHARYTGLQPRDHQIDLAREIDAEALEVFMRVLQQQNGRCHFHRHGFALALGVLGQPACRRGEALAETLQVGMSDRGGDLAAISRLVGKATQRGGVAGTEFVPVFLGRVDDFAQTPQRGFLRRRNLRRLGMRNQVVNVIGLAYIGGQSFVAGGGLANEVERVAHQPLGDVARAFEQTANLHVDAGAQLLGVLLGGHALVGQRIEKTLRNPPEGARRRRFLG